ncbi:hypothetical protein OCGS_0286 [Oceaniovalibus guishaninsula JLT2003]|uniref:OmpA-like domain-containing protein n=1 Tax=Oceaniovalibus guishaninsula JLT2003 TaxID=1231392 RepID=K2HSS8_9RHOB|nr:OmpA family protein [Oceaniovalibus guishaninsula]EKE45669.1 hypothetical protein OCGS_0286 [Oceaniovalibus guishaninsula JLT2003]
MIAKNTMIALGASSLLALAACAPVGPNGGPTELNRTREGALIGAGIGAATGVLTGGDNKLEKALAGAALGAAGGAVVGNVLDRQAAELRSDFSNNAIDVVNTGNELIVRMPQDILFATDSANVSGSLVGDLRVLAANLNRYPNSVVEVQGHTDNTGAAAYNQQLSERRAQAVSTILAQNGVSGSRLRAVGYGENQPIASNLDPAGRAQNRRVQIVIRPTA